MARPVTISDDSLLQAAREEQADLIGLSGLILTKLDGTAKGGVIAAIARERPVPVRFIGVGESLEDLRPFEARAFVDAMLD